MRSIEDLFTCMGILTEAHAGMAGTEPSVVFGYGAGGRYLRFNVWVSETVCRSVAVGHFRYERMSPEEVARYVLERAKELASGRP